MMSDEELRQTVKRGFANPQHLDQLLKRTDLPADRQLDVRANLSKAFDYGKLSTPDLQRFLSQLKSAANLDQFDQVLAELCHTNRLIETGTVAKESPIITSAKEGQPYQLGSTTVQIHPVPEADALYVATDGLIHLDEVKNTAKALRNKLNKKPEQLERMLEWRDLSPDKREIRIVINNEVGWTQIFAARLGKEEAALKILINTKVPLTIGGINLSVVKMNELWFAIRRKVKELKKQGTWSNWEEFYRQISTLLDAERFLGITLS